jgi:hypothetical protein
MGKITRQQLKLHEQAEGLLWGSDKKLTQDQVAFCLEHCIGTSAGAGGQIRWRGWASR